MSQLVWLEGTQTAQCASELKQLLNKILCLTSPFNFAKKRDVQRAAGRRWEEMRVLDWVYRTQASQPPILVPAGIIIVSIVVTAFFAVLPLKLFMSSNFSMLSTLSIFIYTAPNIGTASQRERGGGAWFNACKESLCSTDNLDRYCSIPTPGWWRCWYNWYCSIPRTSSRL